MFCCSSSEPLSDELSGRWRGGNLRAISWQLSKVDCVGILYQSGSLLLPRIGRGRGLRVKVKVEASRMAIVPTVGVDPSDERARLKCLLGP